MVRSPAAAVTLGAFLTAAAASPLLAQQQTAPVATAQAPVAPSKPVVATNQRRWLKADARVCLEFPTDAQVVACSEKYR